VPAWNGGPTPDVFAALRLEPDVDWRHGKGPEVSGAGEGLLMAMAGRRHALHDLSGPGHAKLAHNIGG